MTKITVAGAGYVGMSMSVLLSRKNQVTTIDVKKEVVEKINNRVCPLEDECMIDAFRNWDMNLSATTKPKDAYTDAEFIIISVPTNYNEEIDYFDCSIIENVIETALQYTQTATFVIKSTIPIGYTASVIEKFKYDNIIFAPEFLREGKALYDNLHPSRIIVGCSTSKATNELLDKCKKFRDTLIDASDIVEDDKKDFILEKTLLMGLEEAESVKLFANTYLALRVAYFNELDSFAEKVGLNASDIIMGVSLDNRIHNEYNNPSFGYGGYCLPKDSKQLCANFKKEEVDEELISAIIASNATRKETVADNILGVTYKEKPTVGVFKLAMKSGSDNYRQSAVFDVMKKLSDKGCRVIIYDPSIKEKNFMGYEIMNVHGFFKTCDVIIANRYEKILEMADCPIYTRDIFRRD